MMEGVSICIYHNNDYISQTIMFADAMTINSMKITLIVGTQE